MENHRFVLTGGGTGGHVYPNIAIFEALKEKYPDAEFLYLGTKKGNESKILQSLALPIAFKPIHSRGLPASIKNPASIPAILHILWGTIQSFFYLRKFDPHLVIGTGGYVAAPVVLAAAILRKKIFLHEQNSIPGRMNQLMARFATLIGISFESTRKFFPPLKTVFTGYPLRRTLFLQNREMIKKKLNIPAENRVVFIFSGSTGSRTINQAFMEIVPHLLLENDLTVITSTGKSYTSQYKAYDETIKTLEQIGIPGEIKGKLIIKEYFNNIEEIYSVADLVIARAGAGSIKEITSLRLPSILIPKIDLPGDHQIMNAREIEQLGGAKVILEDIITTNGKREPCVPEMELLETIKELIHNQEKRLALQANLNKMKRINTQQIILSEIDKLLLKDKAPEASEVKVFYLHAPESEKNYELYFDRTTFGNTLLADHFLPDVSGTVLFEIAFVRQQKEEKLILKKIKGDILVNDLPMDKWREITIGDHITFGDQSWMLNSYSEKIRTGQYMKSTPRKMIGASLGIMVSRIGGFFREIVTAAVFGASKVMDIFSVGWTIANLIRRMVAENALENAFLPIFLRFFHRSPRKQTWKSASAIVNFTLLAALIFSILGIFLAPFIIRSFFPGLVAKGFASEAIRMTRVMLPYLFLITTASAMATLLKAFNRFGLAEGSGLFFSIGFIAGIFLFKSSLGLYSLAYSVLLGGLLQIAFLLPLAYRILAIPSLEFSYSPKLHFRGAANKKYFSQLTPITADTGISQVSTVVDKSFAAALPIGSLSYLYFSLGIFRFPFAVISQAISSVVLKDFSESIALFDREKAKRIYVDGTNIIIFLLVPISILMIMLANPLISLLLQRFKFTDRDVAFTAWALQFYSLGLAAWGIHSLTSRIFSARLDNKTTMILNFFMLITHVSLCVLFVKTNFLWEDKSQRYVGVALATSLSYSIFAVVRILVLKRKLILEQISISPLEFIQPLLKTLLASLIMICAILEGNMIFQSILSPRPNFIQNLIRFVSISFVGITIYFLSSLILKNYGILIFRKKTEKKQLQTPISMLSPFAFMELVAKKPEAYQENFCYKINLYLASSRWEIRNIGVKLIGLFKAINYSEILLELIRSRSECGFIRRNAINSLKDLGLWNEEIRGMMSALLQDHYYEVRVAVLRYLDENMPDEEYAHFRNAIHDRIRHGKLEEKLAVIELMAQKGDASDISDLKGLYLASNSLIREQLLEALYQFYKRKILSKDEFKNHLQNILTTSNHLEAEFKIKSILQRVQKEMRSP